MLSFEKKRILWRVFLFAILGIFFEICSTGFHELRRGHISMLGHSSPWMMLDYGLIGVVIMPLKEFMLKFRLPLPVRAFFYMLVIFAVEFISGYIFDICGIEVWNYNWSKYNLCGYICIEFIPPWYVLGLCVEWLYSKVDAMAVILAMKHDSEKIITSFED